MLSLVGEDSAFQDRFRPMNADRAVVYLDRFDQGPQIGLAERDLTLGDVTAHKDAEAGDLARVQSNGWSLALDST